MTRALAVTFVALLSASAMFAETPASGTKTAPAVQPGGSVADAYGKLPLTFEINQGQADASIQYVSHAQGYTLALRPGQASLSLARHGAKSGSAGSTGSSGSDVPAAITMQLTGSNPKACATQEDERITRSNYLIGNDPAKWHTGIANYGRVRYTSVYPGIDLVYYGNQRSLEHDFLVAPHADPNQIVLAFTGSNKIDIDHTTGDLVLKTRQGEIRLHKPISYQEFQGQQSQTERADIPSRYKLLAHHRVAFQLGRYDHSQSLIIDPVLTYSTYLGGSGPNANDEATGDQASAIAVDASGNSYITGFTQSADFPTTSDAFQSVNNDFATYPYQTGFVSKLNSTGTALLYSTYLGGSGALQLSSSYNLGDTPTSIAIDAEGNAYVAGYTDSPDFPTTPGALQTVDYNQQSASALGLTGFITKLNSTGSALVYSTFLGGHVPFSGLGDQIFGIAVDTAGNAYVAGSTASPDFPTTAGAFQTTADLNYNASFISKLNPSGTALVYSTFLTSPSSDRQSGYGSASAIAIDNSGNAYVTGGTSSRDFPITPGALQTAFYTTEYGAFAPYITKINPSGSALVYSTFLGGIGDFVQAIQVDTSGSAYVAGTSASGHIPLVGGLPQPYGTPASAFIAKLTPSGRSLQYSTLVAGNSAASALAIDESGEAIVTGSADPSYFSITPDGALLAYPGIFLLKLNSTGNAVKYATMFGGTGIHGGNTGTHNDVANAVALNSGTAYLAGFAISTDFPVTSGAFQTVNNAKSPAGTRGDAFISAFNLASKTTDHAVTSITVTASPASVTLGSPITITATTGSSSSAIPTGTVTFYASSSSQQPFPATTATLDNTGVATISTASLPAGTYLISATYGGDASHLSFNSTNQLYGSAYFTVIGPPVNASWLSWTPSTVQYGVPPQFASEIQATDAADDPAVGASVSFSGAGLIFSPAITTTDSNGYAQVGVSPQRVGNFTMIANVHGIATPILHNLQVTPGPLTVTLDTGVRIYGAPNPAIPYNISGLVGSDTVTVNTSSSATATSAPGSYPATATISGPLATNYILTVNPGTLVVTKATLRLQPPAYPGVYGQPLPPLNQFHLSGFVNGDTQASTVTGMPVLTTTATSSSPAGVYPVHIAPGTLSSPDYTFVPFDGYLQIYKAHLTIHPASYTIHAGDPFPTVAYTITGFASGDTQATAVTGAPLFTTNAPSLSKPGRYYIVANPGTLSALNYVFDPASAATNGVLTILP